MGLRNAGPRTLGPIGRAALAGRDRDRRPRAEFGVAGEVVDPDPIVPRGDRAERDAPGGEVHPGEQVRRELVGRRDDIVALAPGEALSDEADPDRRVGDEGDLVGLGADQRGRLPLGPGDRGHQALVLVGPQRPAERGRVEGSVPDQGAAHVQGHHGQAMPEIPAPVAAQRAWQRLDAVSPHQSHLVTVAADRERGQTAWGEGA